MVVKTYEWADLKYDEHGENILNTVDGISVPLKVLKKSVEDNVITNK